MGRYETTSSSHPWRSIGSFMYIGSAGPGPGGGRTGRRRAGGRTAGTILNESTTIFIDFHKKHAVSHLAEAQVPIFTGQMKKASKKHQKTILFFLTFQIRRTRKYRFLLIKTRFLNTAADPADPPEMEHEVRLPTHQQRAGGQDDVSLNKLPQIIHARAHCKGNS